ncbi:MAG: polysaccharide lyase [Akkermansiaceae bacterium]
MKPSLLTILTSALIAAGIVTSAAQPQVLLKEDFNGSTRRGLAGALLKQPQITLAKSSGKDGSHAIRVAYVPDARGSKRITVSYPLEKKVSTATLSFDVCFEQGFDFRKGGKLHGLAPAKAITGGSAKQPNGWSARLMFEDEGKAATYFYDQDKKHRYGKGKTSRRSVLQKGKWHQVDLQVTINNAGKTNGSTTLIIDGKTVAKSTRIMFWSGDGKPAYIEKFLFSTFHGGHSAEWSPRGKDGKPTTVYALFDNIIVRSGNHTTDSKN